MIIYLLFFHCSKCLLEFHYLWILLKCTYLSYLFSGKIFQDRKSLAIYSTSICRGSIFTLENVTLILLLANFSENLLLLGQDSFIYLFDYLLQEYKEELQTLNKRYHELRSAERLFGHPITFLEELGNVQQQIDSLGRIYQIYTEYKV